VQHRRRLLRQHARTHRRHRAGARAEAGAQGHGREARNALSGSLPFTPVAGTYLMVGERTNVAGSPKFAKLVKAGNYERPFPSPASRSTTAPT